MTDVDAARRALEDALGPAEVLSDPLALRLYARDASMVEGGCALVAFPRSRDDIVTCIRVAAEHGLPVVPRGSGTGLVGGSTPIGDALVVVTTKMTRVLEIRPGDRLAWVEPGVPEPRPRERPPSARVHVRARPVLAADVVDRRERQHQRRRPALPRLRRDVEPRARARRRPGGRERRAPGFGGSRGARLRPPSRHGRERRDARGRGGRVRSAHAAARCGQDDAVRFRDRRGLRRHRQRDHRERRGPRCRRDDGPRHRRRGRGLRARGLPDGRGGDPHRRGGRDAGRGRRRRRRPWRRRRGRTARVPCAWPRTTTNAR